MFQRVWVTPIVAGTFLISAVTGVLLFFHIETGLIKLAHQWLSWTFLSGVALHLAINLSGVKRYLGARKGQSIIAFCCLILFLSFFSIGGRAQSPVAPIIDSLTRAPLTTLTLVAEVDINQFHKRLSQSGISFQSDQQSIRDLVGQDRKKQFRVLALLFSKAK